ncbi:MAG: hypothetical protein IPK71_24770 [Myxococcales bacterium]|nr:hypothetical protein [Myxococcales bacterium]
MRWLVEVSAIGKEDRETFCVEADSWQRALQIVRAHRGETSAMSGFSIELLEEGYRAVDPVARMRFVVKRASEGTKLSDIDMTAGGSAKTSVKPEAPKPAASKPEPPKAAPSGASLAKDAKDPKKDAKPAAAPASPESKPKAAPPRPAAAAAAAAAAPRPEVPKTEPSTTNGKAEKADASAPRPAAAAPPAPSAEPYQPMTEPAPTVVAPPPVGAPLPGLPAFTVLSQRSESPTAASPLSYREYVFIVPKDTVEGVAVGVLLGQLELVQASLASAPSGKLVQLAAFDEAYVGKPPRPPLATLVWKDWRGEPVVSFPRKASIPPGSRPVATAPVPSLKPASVPPKATLLEPRTTLDDVRAVRPELAPDTTRAEPAQLAKTTETPAFVPPSALPSSPAVTKSVPPPAPNVPAPQVTKSVPPPAPNVPAPQVAKSVPPPAPAVAVVKSVPPPAAVEPAPAVVKSVPPPAAVEPAPAVAVAKSVPPPAPEPAPATTRSTPPLAATLPLGAASPAIPPPAVLGVEKAPDFTPPPGRTASSARIPIAKVGTRVSGDELITSLFEAMHDLHFLRDAIEGADFCLQLAQEVIPSRACFAHFFDLEKREFCLVRAKGEATDDLVGKRHLEAEPILSAAVKARKAMVRGSEDAMTARYTTIGGAKSLVVAPVLVAGRTLAILEMVNPNDGAPYTQDEANAMTYIAEQFAEFLSSRGLVFDHGRAGR